MALLGFSHLIEAQETKAPLSERAATRSNNKSDSGSSSSSLRVGPVDFIFNAGLSQQYCDNIGLSEKNTEDDFITVPSLGIGTSWNFSQLNTLYSSFGLSFQKYWFHPELDSDTILVTPNSRSDFDFYVGEIHFRVYDNLSIQQDAATVSQLSGLTSFKRLNNICGIDADWDLNLLTFNVGYEYNRFISLEDQFGSLDHGTHRFKDSVAVRMAEVWVLGANSSYGFTDYDQNAQNSGYTYSVGIFSNHTLTEYLRATASVGWTSNIFERSGSINDSSDFNSVTYSVAVYNQLNRWLTHSLEFRRFVELGIGSNFTDIREISYQASVELIKNVSSSAGISYQWLEDSKSLTAEDATYLTISGRLGYQLLTSTSIGLGINHTMKDSSRILGSYDQNRVSIDLSYQF